MVISLREYQDGDWQAVCAIHDAARPDELLGSCDARAFVPIEDDPEVEDLRRARKYVACVGERVVGFVGTEGDELTWLYVNPAFYGQGIGRRLLRRGIEDAGPTAWTIALAGNARALSLYKSEGFREVERYESSIAGFPCTCLRLAMRAQPLTEP